VGGGTSSELLKVTFSEINSSVPELVYIIVLVSLKQCASFKEFDAGEIRKKIVIMSYIIVKSLYS